jgi:multimeric flavodoxin WrbA
MEGDRAKVLVLNYSMYGHTFSMAKAVVEGVREGGGKPILKQVAEIIPRVLERGHEEDKRIDEECSFCRPSKRFREN